MEKEFSCETCTHISITEKEQRMLYNRSGELLPHKCILFDEELVHFTTNLNRNIIFPCISCIQSQYANYEIREEENKDD